MDFFFRQHKIKFRYIRIKNLSLILYRLAVQLDDANLIKRMKKEKKLND